MLEGEAHQRELHAHERTEEVREAGARHPRRRLQIECPRRRRQLHVVADREREVRRIPHAPQLHRVVLAPVRRVVLRQVRQGGEQPVALGLRLPQLPLQGGERLPEAGRLGLLGTRVAPLAAGGAHRLGDAGALGARLLHPHPRRPCALVGLHEVRQGGVGAAAREVGRHPLGLGADQPEVEHLVGRPVS